MLRAPPDMCAIAKLSSIRTESTHIYIGMDVCHVNGVCVCGWNPFCICSSVRMVALHSRMTTTTWTHWRPEQRFRALEFCQRIKWIFHFQYFAGRKTPGVTVATAIAKCIAILTGHQFSRRIIIYRMLPPTTSIPVLLVNILCKPKILFIIQRPFPPYPFCRHANGIIACVNRSTGNATK